MPKRPSRRHFWRALSFLGALLVAGISGRSAYADEKALDPGKIEETLKRIDATFPKSYPGGYPSYAPMDGLKSKHGQATKCETPYFLIPGETREKSAEKLPLRSTRADVHVAGVIAQVRVEQVYQNRGTTPIEATYVFPASTRAAVHGMRMKIGKRIVEAKIQGKEEARQTYETAKTQGYRTTLLEQQRPNVFTMNVANLMPGEEIKVELDYSELLVPEAGIYEFVYPTVVGPRYTGGMNTAKETWAANPYLKKGSAVPYTFGLDLHLESPIGIKEVTSPSHTIQTKYVSPQQAKITLPEGGEGNRDFILRYRLAGDKIESGVLVYEGQKENFFLAMMEPPQRVKPKEIPKREYIFVLDVSCSMYGFPLATAKTMLKDLFRVLRNDDTFNIVLFSGTAHVMNPRSMPVNDASLTRAHHVIDSVRSGGGTELLGALRLAYSIPKDQQRSRNVVLITDGYIGVEAETFRFVRKNLDKANLFSFGIGSSVNRGLIEGVARAGMGEPFVVLNSSNVSEITQKFRKYIQSPLLTQIHVDIEGVQSHDIVPRKLPDLLASRPLVFFGKFKGSPKGQIRIAGYTGQGKWVNSLPLRAASDNKAMKPLRFLWARSWVDILMDQYALLPGNKEIESVVTQVGLNYNLLTQFTSFVAVDSEQVNKSGTLDSVKQPLPLPQGVSNRAVSSGQLQGAATGNSYGSGGLGIRGSGPSGGGSSVGIGSLGTYSRGGGKGGAGWGSSSPSIAYKRSAPRRASRRSPAKTDSSADLAPAPSSPPPPPPPAVAPPAEPAPTPVAARQPTENLGQSAATEGESKAADSPATATTSPKDGKKNEEAAPRRKRTRNGLLILRMDNTTSKRYLLRSMLQRLLANRCGASLQRFSFSAAPLTLRIRLDGTVEISGATSAQETCIRRILRQYTKTFKREDLYKDSSKPIVLVIR